MLTRKLGATDDWRLSKNFMLSAPEVSRTTKYNPKTLVISDFLVPTRHLDSPQAYLCSFMLRLVTKTCDEYDSRLMSVSEHIVEHGLTNAVFTHFKISCGLRLSITAATPLAIVSGAGTTLWVQRPGSG
jgi:hypothetical protein